MSDSDAAALQAAMQGPDPRMAELAYLQAWLGDAAALLVQSQPLAGMVFTEQGPLRLADLKAAYAKELGHAAATQAGTGGSGAAAGT